MNILKFIPVILLCIFTFPASVTAQDFGDEVEAGQPIGEQFVVMDEVITAKVVEIKGQKVSDYGPGQRIVEADLVMKVEKGSIKGEEIYVEFTRTLAEGQNLIKTGDRLLVNMSTDYQGERLYYVIDYVRWGSLLWLFSLFALIVIAIGGFKGVSSLIGLASSFVVIFTVILPGLQEGLDPVAVAIVGSAMIMTITFYLSHGVNEKTSWAVVGTLVSLMVTGILARLMVSSARLSGFGAEEAAFLQVLQGGELKMQGLLLAGIILSTLGVLDDITISQASIVKELKETNAKLTRPQLFVKAMNVGRDHIASLVNTLILVFTGGALPLLLLFTADESRSLASVVNYEIVAEEIVRTLVGSIGLVLAVPITTYLTVWFGFKHIKPSKKKSTSHHGHAH